MIKLSGVERFAQPASEVWRRLSDLSFLAGAIPGLSSLSSTSEDHVTCKVTPGLSFLTGSLTTTIDVRERDEPRMVLGIRSKGIGSMAAVTTTFVVGVADGSSAVDWTATVDDLGGLLKPVGAGLIEASAGRVIASAWEGFRAQLAAQA
ncbi:MAG: SRPBCC domain-containing protein [Spirochaetaceae bacterium]|nr:SRPBCC domain-containing protein [Spirochaetaceae bacterium]